MVINAWWWQLLLRKIEEVWIDNVNSELLILLLESEDQHNFDILIKLYAELSINKRIKIESTVSNKLVDMWCWNIEMEKIIMLWIDEVWKDLILHILASQDKSSIKILLKLYNDLNRLNWKEVHISVSKKIFDIWYWTLIIDKIRELWVTRYHSELLNHIFDSEDYQSKRELINYYESVFFKWSAFTLKQIDRFKKEINLQDKYW